MEVAGPASGAASLLIAAKPPSDQLQSAIATSAQKIVAHFHALRQNWSDVWDGSNDLDFDLDDEADQFESWVRTTAAVQTDVDSLDYRLRHSPELRSTVQLLLDRLELNLAFYIQKTAEARDTGSTSSPSSVGSSVEDVPIRTAESWVTGEMREALRVAAISSSHLSKLKKTIKRVGFPRMPRIWITQKGPETWDLHLRSLIMRASPRVPEELASRIALALQYRKRQMVTLHRHGSRVYGADGIFAPARVNSSETPSHQAARVSGQLPRPEDPLADLHEYMRGYMSTSVQTMTQWPFMSQTGKVSSWETLKQPSSLLDKCAYFQCGCCHVELSHTKFQGSKWIEHLMEDLQPFVCPFENCPDGLGHHGCFETQNDWLEHVYAKHCKTEWYCDGFKHPPETFDTAEEFKSHVRDSHPGVYDEHELQRFANMSQNRPQIDFGTCPLCDGDSGSELERTSGSVFDDTGQRAQRSGLALEDHIKKHFFALFANVFFSIQTSEATAETKDASELESDKSSHELLDLSRQRSTRFNHLQSCRLLRRELDNLDTSAKSEEEWNFQGSASSSHARDQHGSSFNGVLSIMQRFLSAFERAEFAVAYDYLHVMGEELYKIISAAQKTPILIVAARFHQLCSIESAKELHSRQDIHGQQERSEFDDTFLSYPSSAFGSKTATTEDIHMAFSGSFEPAHSYETHANWTWPAVDDREPGVSVQWSAPQTGAGYRRPVSHDSPDIDRKGLGPFPCPYCDSHFRVQRVVNRHVWERHLMTRCNVCYLCAHWISAAPTGLNKKRRWYCNHCVGYPEILDLSEVIPHFETEHRYALSSMNTDYYKREVAFKNHVKERTNSGTMDAHQDLLNESDILKLMRMEDPSPDVMRCCEVCGQGLSGMAELINHRCRSRHKSSSLPAQNFAAQVHGHLTLPHMRSAWESAVSELGMTLEEAKTLRWNPHGTEASSLLRSFEWYHTDAKDPEVLVAEALRLCIKLQTDEMPYRTGSKARESLNSPVVPL